MADIDAEHWKDYFDKRYAAELRQLQAIVERDKDTSLARLIGKFTRWLDANELVWDEPSGAFTISPKDWGDVPRLPTGLPVFLDMWAMGVDFRVPPYLKSEIDKFILDYIDETAPETDALVEIGAGWGRNLFALWYAGLSGDMPLYAADSAGNAGRILERLAALEPTLPVKPVQFDISKPDFSFIGEARRPLFFSYFTMMYAAELSEAFFLDLLAVCPNATFIHFEPVGFQLSKVPSHVSRVQEVEAELRNYNRNLMDLLLGLREKGLIELTHAYRDLLPYRHRAHAISVIIWKGV